MGLYYMGLLTKYPFHSACSVQSVIVSREQLEIRENCSAHSEQRSIPGGQWLLEIFELLEARETPTAASLLPCDPGSGQVPEPRCWRAAGRCTDRRSHKQIFRGNVFSSQRPGALNFFPIKLLTDLWDWQIFESRSAPPSIILITSAWGMGVPPCLVAFLASIGYFRTTDATWTSLDSRF